MSDDPRVEAAAKAITTRYGDPIRRWKQDIDDATVALIAADQWDHEQGIHRVIINDDTVDELAKFLYDEAETGGAPWAEYVGVGSSYCEVWRGKARTVLRIVRGAPRDVRSGQ